MKKHIIAAAAAVVAMSALATPAMAKIATGAVALVVSSDASAVYRAGGVAAGTALVHTGVGGDLFVGQAPTVITLTLTGGAVWKTAPTAQVGAVGTGATVASYLLNTVNAVAAAITSTPAAVGSATATWAVGAITAAGGATTTPVVGDTLTFNTNAATIDLTNATGLVDVIFEAKIGAVTLGTARLSVDTPADLGLIQFKDTFASSVIASTPAVADVVLGFKKFVVDTANSVTKTAAVSKLIVAENSGSPATASKVLVTLSGNFAGLASTALSASSGGNKITSVVASDSAGAVAAVTGTNIGTGGSFNIVGNKAYAVVTVINTVGAVDVAAAGASDIVPTMTVDGNTSQIAQPITAQLDILASGDFSARAGALTPSNVFVVTRNGASFTSNNISSASIIRIADNGATTTTAGLISISAWDAAGAPVTQIGATLPASVLGGHTVTIAAGVLKAAFPTAVRFNINVESSNISVTHLKNVGTGLNVVVQTTGSAKQL